MPDTDNSNTHHHKNGTKTTADVLQNSNGSVNQPPAIPPPPPASPKTSVGSIASGAATRLAHLSPRNMFHRKPVAITAVEEDEEGKSDLPSLPFTPDDGAPVDQYSPGARGVQNGEANSALIEAPESPDDVIPGPQPGQQRPTLPSSNSKSRSSRFGFSRHKQNSDYSGSGRKSIGNSNSTNGSSKILKKPGTKFMKRGSSLGSSSHVGNADKSYSTDDQAQDQLNLSQTAHMQWAGEGILADRTDLELPPDEFAAGCMLLQAAARGDIQAMETLLQSGKTNVNFRDYDRRTALHVAASEGKLAICKYLIEQKKAKVNRSDRWGGSPLDDAHRHRHKHIVTYLRERGATTGSGNRTTNLITAAAEGDIDEVQMLVRPLQRRQSGVTGFSDPKKSLLDVNKGDYDKRTALHLASGEGHAHVVKALCGAGADVNVEDRWKRRPLDDAIDAGHEDCQKILLEYGASRGVREVTKVDVLDQSQKRVNDNMQVEFDELEMIDKIGSGAFGEIYKCRWRGTLVAAKIIKSAKIRRDWVNNRAINAIKDGKDVDEAVREMDNAEMEEDEKDLALADFRQEISVLKGLRHPNIVLLLAYSTTENYECLISELMKCSLLDVFKSHIVQGTRMKHKSQLSYAIQLSRGMTYLHSCKPPIIHRDLKPANLLIDQSGVLKISDFGLSKVRPDPGSKEKALQPYVMTGETGSYRFMAPEVYRHEDYNETVDIYSYAMIFFYLVTGRPPWPTLPGLEAVKRAAEEGDRPNIPRDLDARLQGLLKECWDDNPSVRPPFSQITKTLTQYSQIVFKETEDDIATGQLNDTECSCTIL